LLGIPEAEIRRLIEDPHTGKPIDLETLREHFAKEIATGAVKANLQVANFVLASILGRDGGVQDHRSRVRLAILFAKTRMGWTAAKGHERVGNVLAFTNAGDKGIDAFRRAIRLSPFDPLGFRFTGGLAIAHMMAGQYAEAMGWATARCTKCRTILPAFVLRLRCARASASSMKRATGSVGCLSFSPT
jgi:hypothetical protein